jgi:hypothetical protein
MKEQAQTFVNGSQTACATPCGDRQKMRSLLLGERVLTGDEFPSIDLLLGRPNNPSYHIHIYRTALAVSAVRRTTSNGLP